MRSTEQDDLYRAEALWCAAYAVIEKYNREHLGRLWKREREEYERLVHKAHIRLCEDMPSTIIIASRLRALKLNYYEQDVIAHRTGAGRDLAQTVSGFNSQL